MNLFMSFASLVDSALEPLSTHVHSVLLKAAPSKYTYVFSNLSALTSPQSRKLPLMDPGICYDFILGLTGPVGVIEADYSIHPVSSKTLHALVKVYILIAGYLAVIFIGRLIMASQTRKDIQKVAMLHNFFMASLSLYVVIEVYRAHKEAGYTIYGNGCDFTEKGWPMTRAVWLFYFSKPFEFMDTLIMVLKKNDRQISFLHVFHHASVFFYMWFVVLIAPNGDAYISAVLNSVVHVVMYSYYLLSSLGVKSVAFLRPFITTGQMTQFCLMIVSASWGVLDYLFWRGPEVAYPLIVSSAHIFYMFIMLALFLNFFVKDKNRRKELKSSQQVKKIR